MYTLPRHLLVYIYYQSGLGKFKIELAFLHGALYMQIFTILMRYFSFLFSFIILSSLKKKFDFFFLFRQYVCILYMKEEKKSIEVWDYRANEPILRILIFSFSVRMMTWPSFPFWPFLVFIWKTPKTESLTL